MVVICLNFNHIFIGCFWVTCCLLLIVQYPLPWWSLSHTCANHVYDQHIVILTYRNIDCSFSNCISNKNVEQFDYCGVKNNSWLSRPTSSIMSTRTTALKQHLPIFQYTYVVCSSLEISSIYTPVPGRHVRYVKSAVKHNEQCKQNTSITTDA